MLPATKYARLRRARIAYQVLGAGPLSLVMTPGSFGHVDIVWEDPAAALFLRTLASFSQVIRFDRRGTGASDPVPLEQLPPWESYAEDLDVVLDQVGAERTAVMRPTMPARWRCSLPRPGRNEPARSSWPTPPPGG